MYVIGVSAAHGWLTLACGAQMQFAPIDRPMVRAARRAVRKFMADHPDMDGDELGDESADVFSGTLIRLGLKDWKGLGDEKGAFGKPTPALIDRVLADPVLFDQADAAYVVPWAKAAKEKNGSSPSPNGISTGATQDRIIAGSVAAAKKAGARSVRTAKKSRKPTRAKSSGTSSAALEGKSG